MCDTNYFKESPTKIKVHLVAQGLPEALNPIIYCDRSDAAKLWALNRSAQREDGP